MPPDKFFGIQIVHMDLIEELNCWSMLWKW